MPDSQQLSLPFPFDSMTELATATPTLPDAALVASLRQSLNEAQRLLAELTALQRPPAAPPSFGQTPLRGSERIVTHSG